MAVNIDDLQSNFGWDWHMPWRKDNNDIINTLMAVTKYDDSDWYNEQARMIAEELNKGLCEVY